MHSYLQVLLSTSTECAHVLQPLNPTTNDFNYTQVKVPKGKLYQQRDHNCPKLHTQLIRFDHICAVCLRTAPAGGIVNAAKLIPSLGTDDFFVYDLKDTYSEDILNEYKQNRAAVFGNYKVPK